VLAYGQNDGSLTVIKKDGTVVACKKDAREWIEVLHYSPDCSKLAVGSHDNNIYIYETETYNMIGKLTKHNSFITCFDWSKDGTYIRSVCGAYELLFFKIDGFM
jgi:WD40 repeat protein